MDLAKAVCPECKTKIIGIRPGEKLHEVMVPMDEAAHTVEYEDYFVIKPPFRYFDRRFSGDGCKPVPEDFEYNSGTNTEWLTIEQLQHMIENI